MPSQTYANHRRFDPPYHYFLAPVAMLNLGLTCVDLSRHPGPVTAWLLVLAVTFVVLVLKIRTYPLRVQDRLIRLEETLRMQRILPAELQRRTTELAPDQFTALRFASDDELEALVRRTLDEKLPAKEIKKAILNWRPDEFRV